MAENLNENRVIVAMSGGVDSSVVAAILKEKGYDVIGITIKTWGYMEDSAGAPKHENACCSLDAIFDAKAVARQFDFPHYVVDFSKRFEEVVISDFIEEYLKGRTPNPCIICNRKIKWEELLTEADKYGAKYIATGHYAETGFNEKSGRYFLRNATDSHKDQTYALWGLTQESLSRTLLPLGKYTKAEVRRLAEKYKLQIAKKPDSQEICFVTDNNYERFIRERVPERVKKLEGGDIIFHGKVVGKHKGLPFYTIGQRKGIGVTFPFPVYVKKIDVEKNIIEIGKKDELFSREVTVSDLNMVTVGSLEKGAEILGKIRYKDNAAHAEVLEFTGEKLVVRFYDPKLAVTPGQSAVFYDKNGYVLAGGIIQ
jgi:tRNA-specific 2-thiouridylase